MHKPNTPPPSNPEASKAAAGGPPNFGIPEFTSTPRGLLVKKVDKFGSAGKAGIAQGDEIVAFNGTSVAGFNQEAIDSFVAKIGVGGTINVRVIRASKAVEIAVAIRAKKKLCLDLEEVSVDEVLERKIAP